jgi:hypothetical protein
MKEEIEDNKEETRITRRKMFRRSLKEKMQTRIMKTVGERNHNRGERQ